MKAVLEFNYPQDEIKLRRALAGDKFADALWEIKNKVREHFKYDADSVDVLKAVREMVDATLLEAGEDV
jgi:hypothetical protein